MLTLSLRHTSGSRQNLPRSEAAKPRTGLSRLVIRTESSFIQLIRHATGESKGSRKCPTHRRLDRSPQNQAHQPASSKINSTPRSKSICAAAFAEPIFTSSRPSTSQHSRSSRRPSVLRAASVAARARTLFTEATYPIEPGLPKRIARSLARVWLSVRRLLWRQWEPQERKRSSRRSRTMHRVPRPPPACRPGLTNVGAATDREQPTHFCQVKPSRNPSKRTGRSGNRRPSIVGVPVRLG